MAPQFILASTSPRRVDLLQQLGMSFAVRAPNADESPKRGERPRALVGRLARTKAESVVLPSLQEFDSVLIIAADTIVVSPRNQILGKPRTAKEARQMLASLAGKTHTVLTGYCVVSAVRGEKSKSISRVISSRVTMRSLTKKAIVDYVASGEPMDKAGSYAAQGLGMALIESIRGSYANVVGLPVAQLVFDLEKHFDTPIFGWK